MSNFVQPSDSENQIRRLSDYERLSAIIWIVFGIIQILCLITIIAGIWNIFAGLSRLKLVPEIQSRNKNIPAAFEGLSGYVIIGLINLIFGGVIGLIFVAFDLYVRDQILSNQYLFDGEAGDSQTSRGFQDNYVVKDVQEVLKKAAFTTGTKKTSCPTMQDLETIERLSKMRDQGVLTEDEFQEAKAKILK